MLKSNLFIFLRTIKSLSFKQIFYRFFYYFKRKILIFLKVKPLKINDKDLKILTNAKFKNILGKQYFGNLKKISLLEFEFLNKQINFKNNIDWNHPSMNEGTRLFKLNLHYQSFLIDFIIENKEKNPISTVKFVMSVIYSWVNQNNHFDSESFKCSWNSYCVSNRMVNYIKVYCLLKDEISDYDKNQLLKIIYDHFSFLKRNIEYDVSGNHLLENHFSILYASIFFDKKKLFNKYMKATEKVLNNQILDDGAHYELSTMYHGIIFSKLIDLLYYSKLNLYFSKNNFLTFKQILSRMLSWSYQIECYNHTPLLNDSSKSLTFSFKKLNIMYKSLFGHFFSEQNIVPLGESGFRKFKTKNYELLIDIGNIGARDVPGHAHADTFNIIIFDKNGPLFIDPGVSTYNNNNYRLNERSTSFHNTVSLDSINSSEIWSSFRVGKQCKVKIFNDDSNFIHAHHNGYSLYDINLARKCIFKNKSIEIKDIMNGSTSLSFYQNWILAPERNYNLKDNFLQIDGIKIKFKSDFFKIKHEKIKIPSDFNKLISTTRFSIEFADIITTSISFD